MNTRRDGKTRYVITNSCYEGYKCKEFSHFSRNDLAFLTLDIFHQYLRSTKNQSDDCFIKTEYLISRKVESFQQLLKILVKEKDLATLVFLLIEHNFFLKDDS